MNEDDRPRSEEAPSGAGMVLRTVLALGLVGAMVALLMTLMKSHGDGRRAIDTYVETIRGGAAVETSIGGNEAAAITKAFRESESYSVSNFQSQSDTSCFWIKLHGPRDTTEARVVLAERAGTTVVSALSLTRSCDCPDDAAKPCHLE